MEFFFSAEMTESLRAAGLFPFLIENFLEFSSEAAFAKNGPLTETSVVCPPLSISIEEALAIALFMGDYDPFLLFL